MTASRQTSRARVNRSLAVILAATALGPPLAVRAQEGPKRSLPKSEKAWKVNVLSEVFPQRLAVKLRARIEEDRLVCFSGDSVVLEVPLKAISRMSRDTAKDYPAAEFLMRAATQPSIERRSFGSKEYGQEIAARAMLGGLAFFALLFPRHKEEVHVFWIDEGGEHGAEFLMGRREGHVMLQKLQQETGVKARDLEKERKDYERRRKELQRWIKKHSPVDEPERETPQFPPRNRTSCSRLPHSTSSSARNLLRE